MTPNRNNTVWENGAQDSKGYRTFFEQMQAVEVIIAKLQLARMKLEKLKKLVENEELNQEQNDTIPGGKCLKILLIEDEPQFLNPVGELISCYGYRAVLAEDSAAAFKAYQQAKISGEPFDAVIVNQTGSGRPGGLEMVAFLRELDPKVKAFISNGYAKESGLRDYGRYGFVGVAKKPYLAAELMEILAEVDQ